MVEMLIETLTKNCWDEIGVGGDRSCGELKTVTHCRNCPVYSDAGRGLLDRQVPPDYLNEWTEVLAKTQQGAIAQTSTETDETVSVMVFRLGEEWLAVPVKMLQEVTPLSTVHILPHRSNALFLGLVNIRGEILMCVSLKHLLDLEQTTEKQAATSASKSTSKSTEQMVVIAKDGERWVIMVDEVCGFHRFHQREMHAPPVVIAKSTQAYTNGVIHWQGHPVNCLNVNLLFHTLNRRIL
jgi:chemotaxis-related protein WspD